MVTVYYPPTCHVRKVRKRLLEILPQGTIIAPPPTAPWWCGDLIVVLDLQFELWEQFSPSPQWILTLVEPGGKIQRLDLWNLRTLKSEPRRPKTWSPKDRLALQAIRRLAQRRVLKA